jgi:signal peptidase II
MKFWLFFGVVFLIILDLWTKHLAFSEVGLYQERKIFGDWLSVYCITNPGGVWGAGAQSNITGFLTIIRLFAVIFLVWFISRQDVKNQLGAATLGLLLAGAVGNLYDNLSAYMPWPGNGEVRDFIKFQIDSPSFIPDKYWLFDPFPIFNVADSCISIGFILLITGLVKVGSGFIPKED